MATRRCKKSGRLKRRTKSGRKCRKISKCRKGRLKNRKGRRQCRKKSKKKRKYKMQVYCKKDTYDPKECKDSSYPCNYNGSCRSSKGRTLMDDMTLKNEAEKVFLSIIRVGEVSDKINIIKNDQLMNPRKNQLSDLMNKSEELEYIQDFIDTEEKQRIHALNEYIQVGENDKVKIVYTLFPEYLENLKKYTINIWPNLLPVARLQFLYKNSLAIAAKSGNFEIVKFLVENGVNTEYIINHALHYYSFYLDPENARKYTILDPADEEREDMLREGYKDVIFYLAELEGRNIGFDDDKKIFTGDV